MVDLGSLARNAVLQKYQLGVHVDCAHDAAAFWQSRAALKGTGFQFLRRLRRVWLPWGHNRQLYQLAVLVVYAQRQAVGVQVRKAAPANYVPDAVGGSNRLASCQPIVSALQLLLLCQLWQFQFQPAVKLQSLWPRTRQVT